MSDFQQLKKRGSFRPRVDWAAKLELETWDLAGVMRDGLFLKLDIRPVASFRLDHLSADKVIKASVLDEDENTVYCYDLVKPELTTNFIYDDMPMDGL